MKRFFKVLVLAITVLSLFAGCASSSSNYDSQYENNEMSSETNITENKSSFPIQSKSANQQIIADTVLDRQLPGTQYWLYNYSFTNSNECLDKIYIFNVDPDVLDDDYENNYLKKYSYLYLHGKKDSHIQVQKYTRDDIVDEPWYCNQYYYIKSEEHKDKIHAYHSYEIGTAGTIFNNEYFCYTYDDSGRLTETLDDVSDTYYCYYDEQGILKGRTFSSTESDYDEKSYSYERENGNIVKVYIYNTENGNTIGRYEYEYDSDNHIIKENVYSYYENEEKRLRSSTFYSYDDNGNVSKIVKEEYDSDTDSYKTTSKSYFYNDNNNLSKIIEGKGKSIEYTVLVYSDKPNSYVEENG